MCPTYKNVGNTQQILEGRVVLPKQEIFSMSYYNENDVQLLKTSDKPFFNSTILSLLITENSEVKIPEKDNLGKRLTKYAIHFCVEAGPVQIYYNSKDNKPPLLLYEGAKWNSRYFERNIEKIIIEGEREIKVFIIVERLP